MDQVRAKKIAYFIEKIKPRIDLYREVWLAGDYSEEEEQEARVEERNLSQLILNCYVDSWDYSSPESKNGAPKKQTQEQVEQGIDAFLDEILTYEKRCPLAICLFPSSKPWELFGFELALAPYYQLAQKLYPKIFEQEFLREQEQEFLREQKREAEREPRSKQAD